MSVIRKTILLLSLLLALVSLLFGQYSELYFFLEERDGVSPVSEMQSQGGDESFSIVLGLGLFLVLAMFNLARSKTPFTLLDKAALLFVLLLQGAALVLVEIASFKLSLQAPNGWILMTWILLYISLWMTFLVGVAFRLRSANMSQGTRQSS